MGVLRNFLFLLCLLYSRALNQTESDHLFDEEWDNSIANISHTNTTLLIKVEENIHTNETIVSNTTIIPNTSVTTLQTFFNTSDEVSTHNISYILSKNETNFLYPNINNTINAKIIEINDFILDDIQNRTINESKLNETKTIEEIFEEENNRLNGSLFLLNENSTEINPLNKSVVTEIIAAMPGIPIFREPPQIKIHDPDEGPLEPYHHHLNDSEPQFPVTQVPGQKFIYLNRTEFEPEKGSLEETYRHLLIDTNDDDIILPPELDNLFVNTTEASNNITTTSMTSTTIPYINQSLPLIPPPFMSYPYPYGYPYGYNPYLYGYPQYWPQYYGSGYQSRPNMPQIYPNFNPDPNPETNPYFNPYSNPDSNNNNPKEEQFETQTEKNVDTREKMLPKSYPEFGAYIAQVTLDDKQSKEVGAGDEGTLEVMGPIELITTTEPTKTTLKEIKFIINLQNNQKNTKTDRKTNSLNETQNERNTELRGQHLIKGSDTYLDKNTNSEEKYTFNGKRIVFRKRLHPRVRDGRYRRVKIIKTHNKNMNDDNNNHKIGSDENIPRIRERVNKIVLKQHKENQTLSHVFDDKVVKSNKHFAKNESHFEYKHHHKNYYHGNAAKKNETLHKPQRKQNNRPKFLMRAKIRALENLKVDSVTGIKWWTQEQPGYCKDAIYLARNCAEPKLSKRWSFNARDNRCYMYEDFCSQFKANSFESSEECFKKCYRIKE